MAAPYPTIQQAIVAAEPGSVLLVMTGEYPGNITIDKPLSILGTNEDVPGEQAGIIVQAPDPHPNISRDLDAGGDY